MMIRIRSEVGSKLGKIKCNLPLTDWRYELMKHYQPKSLPTMILNCFSFCETVSKIFHSIHPHFYTSTISFKLSNYSIINKIHSRRLLNFYHVPPSFYSSDKKLDSIRNISNEFYIVAIHVLNGINASVKRSWIIFIFTHEGDVLPSTIQTRYYLISFN